MTFLFVGGSQWIVGKSNISQTLGAQVRNEIVAEIVSRAEALGIKKGTYTALILEKWFEDGCPAVNEPDKLMQVAKQQTPKGRKAAS